MDSRLDPVFPPPPRQAQPTDTRQEIRRQEPHDDRRPKSGKQGDQADAFAEEETPRVSVSSLIVFLENLLAAQPGLEKPVQPQAPTSSGLTDSGASTEVQGRPLVQDRAAAAAQAYRHVGDSGVVRPPPIPAPAPPEASAANPVLEAEDVRTIHALLPVLRELAAKGVDTLVLEKAARFLDCLVNAALKARDAG